MSRFAKASSWIAALWLAMAGTAEFARRVYATGKERWSLLKIHACGHPANVFWGVGIPMLPHG